MENSNLMSLEAMQNILGQSLAVTKTNAEGLAIITEEMNHVKNLVGGIASKLNNQSNDITDIKDRMTELELNEEITEEMANNIRELINKRIAEMLHYDEDEIAKYFRTFIIQCYSSLKKVGMGSSYRRTRKRNYQLLVDKIESWTPDEGIQNLKDKIDKRSEAKRNALKNGYVNK